MAKFSKRASRPDDQLSGGFIRRSDSTTDTFYLPSDHVGSVDAVLNASGTVLVRTSFDAWGGRRDDDWAGVPSAIEYQRIANTTRRGFGDGQVSTLAAIMTAGGALTLMSYLWASRAHRCVA